MRHYLCVWPMCSKAYVATFATKSCKVSIFEGDGYNIKGVYSVSTYVYIYRQHTYKYQLKNGHTAICVYINTFTSTLVLPMQTYGQLQRCTCIFSLVVSTYNQLTCLLQNSMSYNIYWVLVVTCAVHKILCQIAVCLAERPTWASLRTSQDFNLLIGNSHRHTWFMGCILQVYLSDLCGFTHYAPKGESRGMCILFQEVVAVVAFGC